MDKLFLLALGVYFSSLLSVSGLAKLDQVSHFAATLRQQRFLPHWSIKGVSKVFPWAEIAVAILIITGISPRISGAILATLFGIFLFINMFIVLTKRTSKCGCYGIAFNKNVDGASVITSALLFLLASIYLLASNRGFPPNAPLRIIAEIFLLCLIGWLSFRILKRKRKNRRSFASSTIHTDVISS